MQQRLLRDGEVREAGEQRDEGLQQRGQLRLHVRGGEGHAEQLHRLGLVTRGQVTRVPGPGHGRVVAAHAEHRGGQHLLGPLHQSELR